MKKLLSVALLSTSLLANLSFADDHHDKKVEIKSTKAADNIYMIQAKGGNIGVFKGDDKTLLIDSQFSDISKELKQEISKISGKPIKFLLNTHFHYDHTDGNVNFGKDGAHIIAHEFVYDKLKNGTVIKAFDKKMDAAPEEALPFLTHTQGLHIHEGDENIDIFAYKGHTGGDSVVFFKTSNVVHTGDIYFNGWYPFIDISNGGSVEGMILSMEDILTKIDDETVIIPGHGAISNKQKMQKDLNMLKGVSKTVMVSKKSGKTKDEIVQMPEIQKYDAEYGQAFLSTEKFIEILYNNYSN